MPEDNANIPAPADYGVTEANRIKPLKTPNEVFKEFSRISEDPNCIEEDYVALYAGVIAAGRPNGATRKLKILMSGEGHLNGRDLARLEKRGRELVEEAKAARARKRELVRDGNLLEITEGHSGLAHPSWDIADPLGATMEEAIATLTKRWRVISVSGKVRFLCVPDPRKLNSGKTAIETMSSADFALYHADRKLYDADTEKWVNPASVFVDVAQRLSGLSFAPPPASTEENSYNLYRGRPIEAREGSCSHLKNFIRDTVCRGREDVFEFVWLWLAHLVQRPGEKPQTALVLRGLGGCGKSTFGILLERLAAPYSMTISEPEHVTGRFAGAHLATCILAVCTEALFAGDPRVNGKIKSLVTSEGILAEPKGLPVVQMPSCLRLFFDSNNDRVVPIDGNGSERRYLVMEINDDHMNDAEYFEPIYQELNGAGFEALAYELANYDPAEDGLRWADVRIAPDTLERRRMRWHSMRPVERAIIRMIEDGSVTMKTTSGQTFRYTFEEGEPIRIPQPDLRMHLRSSMNQHEAKDGDIENLMTDLFGDTVTTSDGAEYMTVKTPRGPVICEEFVPSSDATADEWEVVRREKIRCFEFPPIAVLRAEIGVRFDRSDAGRTR